MKLTTTIGALRYELAWSGVLPRPSFETRPTGLLVEGTEVLVSASSAVPWLVIDHRNQREESLTYAEIWRRTEESPAETPGADLLVLSDAP